jgi:hypothetical protein
MQEINKISDESTDDENYLFSQVEIKKQVKRYKKQLIERAEWKHSLVDEKNISTNNFSFSIRAYIEKNDKIIIEINSSDLCEKNMFKVGPGANIKRLKGTNKRIDPIEKYLFHKEIWFVKSINSLMYCEKCKTYTVIEIHFRFSNYNEYNSNDIKIKFCDSCLISM